MTSVLRRSWRGIKPNVGAQIDWSKAPASLVVCFPFNEGLGSPREYVTNTHYIGATYPNSFGRTTWRPYGFNMSGGGTAGAREISPPALARMKLDHNRSTWAWKQKNDFTIGLVNTTSVFHNTYGAGKFRVEAPMWYGVDQLRINFDVNATVLNGVALAPLTGRWVSLMASYSTGTGADARVGMALWDDGTLAGSQGTCGSTPSLDTVALVGSDNAALQDIEYWYVFNEFHAGNNNDLAMQLAENPYWFFTDPRSTLYSFAPVGCVSTLTDDDLISFRWDAGDRQLVNEVVAELDHDAVTDTFAKMLIFRHEASIRRYGPRPPIRIQSQGLRTDLGADAFLEARAREIFQRFGDAPPAVVQAEVFYRKGVAWEAGDIICLTSAFIPNLLSGGRGITDEPFELVDYRPQFADRGRLVCTLLDIEAITPVAPFAGDVGILEPTAVFAPLTELSLAGVALSTTP